jgi:hypothetical protein
MAKRGRPKGSVIALLDDPGRFKISIWCAFSRLGLTDHAAAYIAAFLVSDRPISTNSIEDVLLISTVATTRYPDDDARKYANDFVRKARKALTRADGRDRAWLVASASAIVAVVQFAAAGNWPAVSLALSQLRSADWTETLDNIGRRVEASLASNFPPHDPAENPLSRPARRLLRQVKKTSA